MTLDIHRNMPSHGPIPGARELTRAGRATRDLDGALIAAMLPSPPGKWTRELRAIRSARIDPEERQRREFDAYLRGPRDRERVYEYRDLAAGAVSGSYLVPPSFEAELVDATLAVGAALGKFHRWDSPNGSPSTGPPLLAADTTNVAAQYTENSQYDGGSETDPVFSRVQFSQAPIWGNAELWRVSRRLVEDSAVDVQAALRLVWSNRLARALEKYALTDATNGLVANTTNTTTTSASGTVTYSDLVTWFLSLDESYRGSPDAFIVCHDSTLKTLLTIADTAGREKLLSFSESANFSDQDTSVGSRRYFTFAGVPILTNPYMPTFAAGATVALLADGSRAGVLRMVKGSFDVQRLDERFADYGEYAYASWSRADFRATGFGAAALIVHA